ncbi:hypothetical protein [Nocardia sp. NBC_00416]|uniref:hypothetical protein n=1 Tax=Nocardia sp. NBC_00416 TaxID=2975991 RepID=UPI002E2494B5
MLFEVKVSRYGSQWLLSAPAFGLRRIVTDEKTIRQEAYRMIAQCGAAPDSFQVELVWNRALDTA